MALRIDDAKDFSLLEFLYTWLLSYSYGTIFLCVQSVSTRLWGTKFLCV